MTLADEVELLGERQAAGILDVTAIDHVAKRPHTLPRVAVEPDRPHGLAVNHGNLLPRAQIADGGHSVLRSDAKRHTEAGAAPVEPKHKAQPLGSAAMHERIDAERAVRADETGRDAFKVGKARLPHERAIAKHPKVVLAVLGGGGHCGGLALVRGCGSLTGGLGPCNI